MQAGGRYDGLLTMLGGHDAPGVGWAAGVERLVLMREELDLVVPRAHTRASLAVVVIRPKGAELDQAVEVCAQQLVQQLRLRGLAVNYHHSAPVKKQMTSATKVASSLPILSIFQRF